MLIFYPYYINFLKFRPFVGPNPKFKSGLETPLSNPVNKTIQNPQNPHISAFLYAVSISNSQPALTSFQRFRLFPGPDFPIWTSHSPISPHCHQIHTQFTVLPLFLTFEFCSHFSKLGFRRFQFGGFWKMENGDGKPAMSGGDKECVRVAVNIRPLITPELMQGCTDCISVVPGEPQVWIVEIVFLSIC